MKAPEPGVYPGIPAEDYHRWDAANYSTLKQFQRSAAHARDILINPPEQSEAMVQGQALHDAVLEPELFAKEYAVAPDVGDRRFKAAKAEWAAFVEESGSKTVLTLAEWNKIDDMRCSIRNHPIAVKILDDAGYAEYSFVWIDEDSGALCKGRVDWFGRLWGNAVVCDLKSTRDASPQGWPKQIANFQYHVQASFYMDGLNTVAPSKDRTWLWLAVENATPFCSAVYQAEPGMLDEGRRRYKNYLAKWVQCQETGVWAGYPAGLNMVDIPHWAYTSDEEEGIF
jgi:hypothetical protein